MSFFTVKNDSLSLRLRASRMRIATLGKIFNIFPQSLFLVGSDGTVATPDEEGDFETYDMSQDTEWTVSGDFSKPTGSHSATDFPSGSTNSQYAYQSQQPEASSLVHRSMRKRDQKRPSGSPLYHSPWCETNIVVWQSRKAREESLDENDWICTYDDSTYAMRKTLNLPITLSEKTASVNRVAEIVSLESFEGEEVVLLDSDNLKIPDSAGTRGMWLSYNILYVNKLLNLPVIKYFQVIPFNNVVWSNIILFGTWEGHVFVAISIWPGRDLIGVGAWCQQIRVSFRWWSQIYVSHCS